MALDGWRNAKLGALIDVKHGFAFQGEFFNDEPPGDILLTPGNFAIGGGFKSDKLKYYVGPVPDDFVLQEGDILITMTDLSKNADTLGYPAIVPKPRALRYLHNQRLGKVIIKDRAPLRKDFLYYLLRTREYRHEVVSSATGTTVKHTSPERVMAFEFQLAPLPEQRAIAHILGTLDDKIELNRRMNETLEAMARAIFKSWFIDFDPVRAKAEGRLPAPSDARQAGQPSGMDAETAALFPDSFEDSPLGKIPKGWRVSTMPDVIEINPTRSLSKGEIAPYLDMQNMLTQGHRPAAWVNRPFGSGTKFINGDTLLARITPCLENGKTAFVDFLQDGEVGWGSTEYIVLRSKPPLPVEYGYYLARSEDLREFAIQNMTGSSGRQRVPADCFAQYLIAVPPVRVAKLFGKRVNKIITSIKINDEQSHTLAATRDALLPKLLSGELRVKNAETFIEMRA